MAINLTSMNNTPQARDDTYSFSETSLESGGNILWLDVTADDGGGKAKVLYSVDDGLGSLSEILQGLSISDIGQASGGTTAKGGSLSIVDGKVRLDVSGALAHDGYASVNSLGEGQVFQDSFTYAIQMANGTLSWATVRYSIVGANDAVSFGAGTGGGSVMEDGVPPPPALGAGGQQTSGTLVVQDADLSDTHTLSAMASGNATALGSFALSATSIGAGQAEDSVGWTYTLDNAAAQYLGADDSVTESFVVTVDDGHGSTAQTTVSVAIHGTNDAVTIDAGGDTGSVTEDGTAPPPSLPSGGQQTSGVLTIRDVDLSDTHAVSAAALGNTTNLGSFALSSGSIGAGQAVDTVGWTYTLNNASPQVQALAAGETVTESFQVTVSDGHGSTALRTVAITITGVNDAAQFIGPVGGTVTEDLMTSLSGLRLVVDDIDGDDIAAAGNLQGTYGTFTFTAVGAGQYEWGYVLTNGAPNVQALNTGDIRYDTVQLTAADGTTQLLTVTIHGVTEPVVTTPQIINGSGQPDSIPGTGGADIIHGLGGDDTLQGRGGDDQLFGDGGNDTLDGGSGTDLLSGSGGNDIFQFTSPLLTNPFEIDRIIDFNANDNGDEIQLSKAIFVALSGTSGPLQPTEFATITVGTDAAVTGISPASVSANARIVFNTATGGLFYDANGGSMSDAIEFAVVVVGAGALTYDDFAVIA